jgi:hypothetical protein
VRERSHRRPLRSEDKRDSYPTILFVERKPKNPGEYVTLCCSFLQVLLAFY